MLRNFRKEFFMLFNEIIQNHHSIKTLILKLFYSQLRKLKIQLFHENLSTALSKYVCKYLFINRHVNLIETLRSMIIEKSNGNIRKRGRSTPLSKT